MVIFCLPAGDQLMAVVAEAAVAPSDPIVTAKLDVATLGT